MTERPWIYFEHVRPGSRVSDPFSGCAAPFGEGLLWPPRSSACPMPVIGRKMGTTSLWQMTIFPPLCNTVAFFQPDSGPDPADSAKIRRAGAALPVRPLCPPPEAPAERPARVPAGPDMPVGPLPPGRVQALQPEAAGHPLRIPALPKPSPGLRPKLRRHLPRNGRGRTAAGARSRRSTGVAQFVDFGDFCRLFL